MKRIHLSFGIFVLMFLIDVILYIYQPLGENFYIIGDLTIIIFSFLALGFGIYAYKLHGFSSIQGKALLLLSLGTFFWFLGETTWGIYEIVLGVEAPVASIADVFWIIGYPLFLLGLFYVLKTSSLIINKKRMIILTLLVIFISYFMINLLVPTITDVEMSIAEKTSTAGYVLGDMLLIIYSMIVIIYLFGGKFAKAWNIILLAMLMATIADIYYMNFLEVYETGNLIDLLWDLDYILLAFGFFYHREIVEKTITKIKKK